jgi:hypothetical protein
MHIIVAKPAACRSALAASPLAAFLGVFMLGLHVGFDVGF